MKRGILVLSFVFILVFLNSVYSDSCSGFPADSTRCIYYNESQGGPSYWVQYCDATNYTWFDLEECPNDCDFTIGACIAGSYVCDDGSCETNLGENCDNCPEDCLPDNTICYGGEVYDILDCVGDPFTNDECIEYWGYDCIDGLGDGFCDDGTYGINFNCEEFEFDNGDCEGGSILPPSDLIDCSGHSFTNDECIEIWGYGCIDGLGDGFCDDGTYGINFNCNAYNFDNGDCEEEGSFLPYNVSTAQTYCYFMDCYGSCITKKDFNFIGDGICDFGQRDFDFNCDAYNFDGADCECIVDITDCSSFEGNAPVECVSGLCNYIDCNGNYICNRDCYGIPYPFGDENWGVGEIKFDLIGRDVVKNHYLGPSYDACFLGERIVYGDGVCHKMFNCADWNWDGGDCNRFGYEENTLDVSFDQIIPYFNLSDFNLSEDQISFEQEYIFRVLSYTYNNLANKDYFKKEYETKLFLLESNDLKLNTIINFEIPVSNLILLKQERDFLIDSDTIIMNRFRGVERLMSTYKLEEHKIEIIDISSETLILDISSESTFTLNVKQLEENYVDLNSDGFDDVVIKWTDSNDDGSINLEIVYLVKDVSFVSGEEFENMKKHTYYREPKILFKEILDKYEDLIFIVIIVGISIFVLILFGKALINKPKKEVK